MTPNFAVVGVDTPDFHMPRLWLPVFLLWVPVILLSPVIFLVLVVVAIFTRTTIWRIIAICWGVLSGLTGTYVQVSTCDARILVRIPHLLVTIDFNPNHAPKEARHERQSPSNP